MAKSINQVILMGNLTRDPEIRQTPTGQDVVGFSLALNRSYKDTSGEWQEATDYVDIVAWGKLAEQVNDRLSTGSKALVTGRLQSRSWEQDGVKRNKLEVLATDVTFFGDIKSENGWGIVRVGVYSGNPGTYKPIKPIPESEFMDYLDRVIGKKKVIHKKQKKD